MPLDFDFSLDELAAAEAQTANPYLSHPAKGLHLITQLIASPPPRSSLQQKRHLDELHRLIHEDFVSLAARDDYPAEAQAFRELLALEESLEHLSFFPDLANKTIIGVGGGFSAGKSRFLNSLLGQALLPESLEPTTAIPTFLTGGEPRILALNRFEHAVEIDGDALQAISHAFYRHYQQSLGEGVGFAQALRLLLIQHPRLQWWNRLAFLDTPGYSKSEGRNAGQTDEKIALKQLTEADHIVWLLNAKNGSIRRDDLDFLHALNHPKPIFFVITQSDLVGGSRIESILESTRRAIGDAGLASAGIMAWAAPLGTDQSERIAGAKILDWLDRLNEAPKYTTKRLDCERLFDRFIQYNQDCLAKNRQKLTLLNSLLPLAEHLPDSERNGLRALIQDERANQQRFVDLTQSFEALKNAMLEAIGHIVGQLTIDDDQSAQAWYQSGMRLLKENGSADVSQSEQAAACLLKAAEQGHVAAQVMIASLYAKGQGVKVDVFQAAKWYGEAAEQGHAEAQFEYGRMYRNSFAMERNDSHAAHWYGKAAEQGHPDAQFELAGLYHEGGGVANDLSQALHWYRAAAQQGHLEAQFRLGRLHADGRQIAQDWVQAVEWYRRAAERGHAEAQFELAHLLAAGDGVASDLVRAIHWFRKAAKQGHAEAQLVLGELYQEGCQDGEIEQDADQAMHWYREAADQGHAEAQFRLGLLYEEGRPETHDHAQLKVDFPSAKDAAGRFNFREIYQAGQSLVRQKVAKTVLLYNRLQSTTWYRKAAEQGHAEAQYRLGRCYHEGHGVAQDEQLAIGWYRKAAEQGHAEALNCLAHLT